MATETGNFAPIAAKVSTYGGSAGAVFFGLTANEMAALGGVLIGLLGLAASLFFQVRNDRRNAQKHELEMRRLRREVEHHG